MFLSRCELGGFFGPDFLVLPLELIDSPGGIDQLLLAGKERMAVSANFYAERLS